MPKAVKKYGLKNNSSHILSGFNTTCEWVLKHKSTWPSTTIAEEKIRSFLFKVLEKAEFSENQINPGDLVVLSPKTIKAGRHHEVEEIENQQLLNLINSVDTKDLDFHVFNFGQNNLHFDYEAVKENDFLNRMQRMVLTLGDVSENPQKFYWTMASLCDFQTKDSERQANADLGWFTDPRPCMVSISCYFKKYSVSFLY